MNEEPDWRDIKGFYKSTGECQVCQSVTEIGIEPRFSYRTCEQHSVLSPVEFCNEVRILQIQERP